MEPLEPRFLFAGNIDTSSVGLFTVQGDPATLDRNRPVWLVAHGLTSSKGDPLVISYANALAAGSPDHQVLIVDWSVLAVDPPEEYIGIQRAWAAADAIATFIRAAKIKANRIDFAGLSMGAQVAHRLAQDIGPLGHIVAVDPAAVSGKYADQFGKLQNATPNFKADAKYSLAFFATASLAASLSAHATIQLTGLVGGEGEQHDESQTVVNLMLNRNAGFLSPGSENISRLFSSKNILGGKLPAWKNNGLAFGFEATLLCRAVPESASNEFEPLQLLYKDKRNRFVFAL